MRTVKISALDELHLLPEACKQIQSLSTTKIQFFRKPSRSEAELIARTNDAEAILVGTETKIGASYLEACPSVKYVGLCGTSHANMDIRAIEQRGIVWTNVVDYSDEPTAEFIFMQLEMLARGAGLYQWKDEPRELMGKTIAIIGLGALGKAIAHLALAYKMKVLYYSLHRKPDWEQRGVHYADLPTLLQQSQIIVISTPSNVQVLGKKEFDRLATGSILVQASLGDSLDQEAFLKWIAKKGNYAIFDYAAGEEKYQRFKDLSRVIFSKVVAGFSYEARERLGQKVVDHLMRYIQSRGN